MCVCGILAIGTFAASGFAQDSVWVKVYDAYGSGGSEIASHELASGEDASIPLATGARRVNITTDKGTLDIGALTFTGGPAAVKVHLLFGTGVVLDGTTPSKVGNNLDGLDASALFDARLYGGVSGNLTGDVIVDGIARFDVGGSIDATIEAVQSHEGSADLFIIEANKVSSTGSISCTGGDVEKIAITTQILGDISVSGNLDSLTGTSAYGQTGAAAIGLTVGGDLLVFEVNGSFGDNLTIDITGNIQRFRGAIDGNPQPFRADMTVGGFVLGTGFANLGWVHNGDFSGSMKINGDLDQKFVIDGTVTSTAEIWVTENIQASGSDKNGIIVIQNTDSSGSTMAGLILVDGTLISTSRIEIKTTAGLTGQIIINADASGGPGHTWNGEVIVGSITLDPTDTDEFPDDRGEYITLASALGGGAIGLVGAGPDANLTPIGIHHESCSPVHDTTVAGAPASATIQFYGPVVKETSGDDMPVRVYRGPFGSTNFGLFTDITSDCSAVVQTDRKQLKVTPDSITFRPKYRYWFKPIVASPGTGEATLLCDDLTTSSDIVVDDDEYWFDVDVTFASLDLSSNGIIDTADTAIWLGDPVDFNGDNTANTTDLDMITSNLGRTE